MKIKLINSYDINIAKFLFKIRKKKYVKTKLKSKAKTNFKKHNKWLINFFSLKKGIFYFIYKKNQPIGYVRVDRKRNFKEVSWALLKKFHNKGYAKKTLLFATRKREMIFKANVRKDNISSIRLAEKCGFEKIRLNKLFFIYKKFKG